MSEPHVVAALKDTRAKLAGMIADLEKGINGQRADLVHLDATLRMFAQDTEAAKIGPKAVRQRNAWFGKGECARLGGRGNCTTLRPIPTSWSVSTTLPRMRPSAKRWRPGSKP